MCVFCCQNRVLLSNILYWVLKWLWIALCVLQIKSGFSAKVSNTLTDWDISSALKYVVLPSVSMYYKVKKFETTILLDAKTMTIESSFRPLLNISVWFGINGGSETVFQLLQGLCIEFQKVSFTKDRPVALGSQRHKSAT